VTSSCFYQLRRLRQIRRPVRQELIAQLAHSFILSRLDYNNLVLADLPKLAIMLLQCVQNAAARLILDLPMNEHVTPAPRQLHWLPIYRRVKIVHHDALNPHRSVSDVFFRHGACSRRQPDEVHSAIRQHRSIQSAALSHLDWQALCSHKLVLSPGTIFHRHSTVSLT